MLKNILVTKWSDTRDSSHRVAALDGGVREFILNSKLISDVTDIHTTAEPVKSRFNYSDNRNDRREGLSTIEAWISPADIITWMDATPHSNAVTLYIHRHNNIDYPTDKTTILIDQIAYVDRYNPAPTTHCWLVYYKGAFKRMEVLVGHGLEEFIDIIQTGTTTAPH